MDLDHFTRFPEIDQQNMLSHIEGLPDQLMKAWQMGQALPLPDLDDIQQILISGMGGSAIGADLVAAYAFPFSSIPITVHRDYDLPAWAKGPHTLVIACSHSGNTEETLSTFEQASRMGCARMAITTGGKLAEIALRTGVGLWEFEHKGQPRAAVGYSFGLLLAILARMQILPDSSEDLQRAVASMHEQQESLRKEILVVRNPAKRQAGQLMGRVVTVMGSGLLAPVARRWKGQINELAKSVANFELLPEADHNTLAGTMNPEDVLHRCLVIFLRSSLEHPRNQLRNELTRKVFMLEGLPTDYYDARGDTPLGQMWTSIHFGDYMAYYLALSYDIDPTPVAALEGLKRELRASGLIASSLEEL